MLDLSQKYLYEINEIKYVVNILCYDETNDTYTISVEGLNITPTVAEGDLIEDTTIDGIDLSIAYYFEKDSITYFVRPIYYNTNTTDFCVSVGGSGETILCKANELTEVE